MEQQELIEKISQLPQDQRTEVEKFVDLLARQQPSSRIDLHRALAQYALQHAGTSTDLDPDLEAASIDHLLQQDSAHFGL